MARRPVLSTASRVILILTAAVAVTGAVVAILLVLEAQRAARAEAEHVTRAVAVAIAGSEGVAADIVSEAASDRLEPYVEDVRAEAGLDFITIMTADGIRITHPDPDRIGEAYIGTIPDDPRMLTEQFSGTLGPSVRTIAPVTADGQVVGWVAVGVTVQSITSAILSRLPFALLVAVALAAAGFAGAYAAGRVTRRVTGDLPPGAVRDTLSSYESVRTLGEALRAQTHEHGNRLHTALALLELGRTEQAIEILAETSRQSQALVDQVTLRREGDPTVGALLLGKAAQARERGIDWSAEIAPDAPAGDLAPVDAVSVVGNLIDNALDAAAAGSAPRWVRVQLARAPGGALSLAVSDSGDGVPPELADRIWERGFSTKDPGAEGRGVGLALVRSIVETAGGSVEAASAPTTFRVTVPGRRS